MKKKKVEEKKVEKVEITDDNMLFGFNFFDDPIEENKVENPVQIFEENGVEIKNPDIEDPLITRLNFSNDEFGQLLKKIAKWLLHQNKLGKLPKTKEKLVKALTSMCYYKKKIDVSILKQHLIKEGYMSEQSGTITFTKKDIEKYQTSKKRYGKNLSDEEIVVDKCINWIEKRDHYPKTVEQVNKALIQLSEVKKCFDLDQILEYFKDSGVIRLDSGDTVFYNLID